GLASTARILTEHDLRLPTVSVLADELDSDFLAGLESGEEDREDVGGRRRCAVDRRDQLTRLEPGLVCCRSRNHSRDVDTARAAGVAGVDGGARLDQVR